jgi:hypothetical protein
MTCLRFGTIVVAAVLVAAVRPTDVTAQNVAGTWVLSVTLDVGTGSATLGLRALIVRAGTETREGDAGTTFSRSDHRPPD